MREDADLLRGFVVDHSNDDFKELVSRYLDLVYQAALRRSFGRSDLAEEAVQEVFIQLARRAPKLLGHPVLAGWLYTTTRHVVNDRLRAERRRLRREQEAYMRNDLNEAEPEVSWERLRPELDGAMDQLPDADRAALLLRFFHNQAFAQIGVVFGLSEDTARKRVERALDRLRERLVKRGITSTGVALGVLLSSNATTAAPVGLGQVVALAALAPATAHTLSVAGIIHLMNTKLALNAVGVVGLTALIGLSSMGLALYAHREAQQASAALEVARQASDAQTARLQRLRLQAQETDQRLAKLQADAERARKTVPPAKPDSAQPVSGSAARPGALTPSEKEAFLTRYGQIRTMLGELGKAQLLAVLAPFFQSAHLSAAQIAEFTARTTGLWYDTMVIIPPGGIIPGVTQLPDDQLRGILGDDGFQRFQEFNRVKPAYDVSQWVRLAVGYTETPLSDAQANQVAQAIVDHSDARQPGVQLQMSQIDWGAVTAQIPAMLTPNQFKAAQPVLLNFQYLQALNLAQKQSAGPAPQPTPSR